MIKSTQKAFFDGKIKQYKFHKNKNLLFAQTNIKRRIKKIASNTQAFKNFWKVSKPSKLWFFMQCITSLIASIFGLLTAIPTANAISYISVANYDKAIQAITLNIILVLIKTIFWRIEYFAYSKQIAFMYPQMQKQIIEKIIKADDVNFKYTSKEKIVNTLTTNIFNLADFCDQFAIKISSLIEAVVTFIIIFSIDLKIGLVMLTLAIFVFLIINAINKAIAHKNNHIQNRRDSLSESFIDIIEGRNTSSDLNISADIHNKYFEKVSKVTNLYHKRIRLQSFRDNWVYLTYTIIIFLCSIFLVKQVSLNQITLNLYLVITPYLTTAITKIVDFFQVLSNLQTANISALRVKTIQEMSEKDIVDFGNNLTDKIEGSIVFSNISYSPENNFDPSVGKIDRLNTQITKNTITLIEGKKGCGKRALFYLLKRTLRPSQGTITLDNINIYDFDNNTYKKNISHTSRNPHFFNDTILENLKYIEKSKKKIFEVCELVGIHKKICSLPDGYDTNLSLSPTALSSEEKFLLGLARIILLNSEVLMIYEFPPNLNNNEISKIKRLLKSLKSKHTIIIFSALDTFKDISNKHIKIEQGKVTILNS